MPHLVPDHALGGQVPLDGFSQALEGLALLVELLAKDVSGDASINWLVDDLAFGSAVVTIRGETTQPEAVEKVGRAYAVIGQSLEQGQPIPYSLDISKAAHGITQILNGQITSIHFEVDGEVATVTSSVPVEQAAGIVGAYGSIEGRIETLTHRRWLGFMLYDLLHDRAIRCYLRPDQEGPAREAWNHRVFVSGWIRRDPVTGLPISINPVHSIDPVPDVEPGAFLRARGVAPAGPNEPTPEEVIRRFRDA